MDDKAKKKRLFDEVFGSAPVDGISERMNWLKDEALSMKPSVAGQAQPVMLGFHLSFNDNGQPFVEEFGNTVHPNVREPLTEIFQEGSDVVVVMELPGVDVGDIDIRVKQAKLSLKVDSEYRKYNKIVDLGLDVVEDEVQADLKNGVLQVRLRRK